MPFEFVAYSSIMANDKNPLPGLAAAALYGCCSVITTVVNKWILSSWGFSYTNTLLFFQNISSLFFLVTLKELHFIQLANFDKRIARRLIPLSLAYTANVFCGLSALRLTSVPVYNVIKRMTPVPAMLMDTFLRGVHFSRNVQVRP